MLEEKAIEETYVTKVKVSFENIQFVIGLFPLKIESVKVEVLSAFETALK